MTDQQEKYGEISQVNEKRRRITKAGLAIPAVIGTLASRQVLGADAWNCTPSGQVSGNISRPGAVQCNTLGTSPANWVNAAWPTPYIKGVHNTPDPDPKNWPPSLNPTNATLFNAVFGNGVDIFKYVPVYDAITSCNIGDTSVGGSGKCKRSDNTQYYAYNHITGSDIITDTTDPRWTSVDLTGSDGSIHTVNSLPATLLEVLSSSPTTDLFVFAQAAIATLLSATQNAPSFPVSATDVVAMFNATYNGTGTYQVNNTVSWNRSQVLDYFQSLYI